MIAKHCGVRETEFLNPVFPLFTSEMTGLLVAWLSTTPPYFATADFIGALKHFNSGCPS